MNFPAIKTVLCLIFTCSIDHCKARLGHAHHILLRGERKPRKLQGNSITCRMTLLLTVLENSSHLEETACVPIVDGAESDSVIPLKLPSKLLEGHENRLNSGRLLVRIDNAQVHGGEIIKSSKSEFSLVTNQDLEKLLLPQEQHMIGDVTVALIRVSTIDSPNQHSRASLDAMLDPNGINFKTQYEKCSMNKLRFNKVDRSLYEASDNFAVFDVMVPSSIATFGTGPGLLVDAAQEQLRNTLGISSVSTIADKILFCLPPGTGSWVASAGLNHWRSQYNSGWCTSLSSTMHELGHQIGLLHANENFQSYEDRTGYMARGYKDSDWPLRCFNGQNNDYLGWYNDRKAMLDPLTAPHPTTINLAAFVDCEKTVSSSIDPVLINLSDELYLQYNRAKGINADTGEMPDQVTIVTRPLQGGSQLVGGIVEGQSYTHTNFAGSGRALYIKACSRQDGDDLTADMMTISIGMDKVAACNIFGSATGAGSTSQAADNSSGAAIDEPSGIEFNSPVYNVHQGNNEDNNQGAIGSSQGSNGSLGSSAGGGGGSQAADAGCGVKCNSPEAARDEPSGIELNGPVHDINQGNNEESSQAATGGQGGNASQGSSVGNSQGSNQDIYDWLHDWISGTNSRPSTIIPFPGTEINGASTSFEGSNTGDNGVGAVSPHSGGHISHPSPTRPDSPGSGAAAIDIHDWLQDWMGKP